MTAPRLVIIAGPNGSGKTTLTDLGRLSDYGLSLPAGYINPDEIAKAIPGDEAANRDREGWLLARKLRTEYRERRISFAFETVFSHPSTLLDMRKCREVGYLVALIYVTTGNVEINVARVQGRVLQGGHTVPEDKIRERYERSLNLLPRAVEDADDAIVFDASQSTIYPCFRKLPNGSISLAPPEYLQVRLVDALSGRASVRDDIEKRFGALVTPDEEDGEYVGPIRAVTSHYAVQEIVGSRFVRHDLLLMDNCDPNATLVRYSQGVGSMR